MNKFASFDNEKKFNYLNYSEYRYDNSIIWDLNTILTFFNDDFVNYLYNKINDQLANNISDITSYINFTEYLTSYSITNQTKEKLICFFIHKQVDVKSLINYNRTFFVNYIKQLYLTEIINCYYVFDILTTDELKEFISENFDKVSIKNIINYIKMKVDKGNYDIAKLKMLIELDGIETELLKTTTSYLFWELVKEIGLSEDCINKRKKIDNTILENPENYNFLSVKKAFCDLYFNNEIKNVMLDIETIIEYYTKEISFKDEISPINTLLELIYDFLQKNTLDNSFNTLIELIKSFSDNKSIGELLKVVEKKMFNSFEKEMNEKLNKTKENITKGINAKQLQSQDGKKVQFYTIANQTDYQKEFLFMTHSTTIRKYNGDSNLFIENYLNKGKTNNKICLSLINNGFIDNFNSKNEVIVLGYFTTDNKNILSTNTRDGQTNQRKIADGKRRKVIKNVVLPIYDFMKNTINYNEITLANQNMLIEPLIPDCIITRTATPSEFEIEVASKLTIPIFYLNKEKYEQYPLQPKQNNIWYDYNGLADYLSEEEYKKAVATISNTY